MRNKRAKQIRKFVENTFEKNIRKKYRIMKKEFTMLSTPDKEKFSKHLNENV